jgi:hypothetical protein
VGSIHAMLRYAARMRIDEADETASGRVSSFETWLLSNRDATPIGDPNESPPANDVILSKTGLSPTTLTYDCRPYLKDNQETCSFTNPAAVRPRTGVASTGVGGRLRPSARAL